MKNYISSILFLISMGIALTAIAYKLDQFNLALAKSMLTVPVTALAQN